MYWRLLAGDTHARFWAGPSAGRGGKGQEDEEGRKGSPEHNDVSGEGLAPTSFPCLGLWITGALRSLH